jgi:peptidyl-prolyl cis-trans isomerase SurA
MLKKLNKIILLCCLLTSGQLFAQQTNIDRVVAVVGDHPILWSELEAQRISAVANGVDLGPNAMGLILDQLLYEKMLVHHAEVDSVEVSDGQIDAELESRIRYFISQVGSKEKLEEFYGKSVEEIKYEFRDLIRTKLLSQAMERKITQNVNITPSEVVKFFNTIPTDSLPFINSTVEFAHLVIAPGITDEAKAAAKRKLERIREEVIRDPNDRQTWCFEAASNSDDPGSSANCGEYDFVTRGTFVPQFDAVAFRLKDGEISDIFETAYGFHIMKLIQRRGEEYKAAHILVKPKVSQYQLRQASQRLDSIYAKLTSNELEWKTGVEKFSTDKETKFNGGKFANPYTGETIFDVRDLEPQLFITLDALKVGEYSRPMQYETQDGLMGFRIVKLLRRTNPHRANLHDDYQMIQLAAKNDKEQKTVETWMKSKIPVTYVWIAEDLRKFSFQYNWLKTAH